MKVVKLKIDKELNPGIDSIAPDFKVFWRNNLTCEEGNSTFFTYEYGAEIINSVFKTMYPEREILKIKQLENMPATAQIVRH